VSGLAAVLIVSASCRRSFTSADRRFASNVDAARALSDGRDAEFALAVCSDAARAGHRRAPLLRVGPARFLDCAGEAPAQALAEALTAARVVLATCTPGGEELLVRDDGALFARWPDDGLEGLACVGKCRAEGCGPPCSESAVTLAASVCQGAPWSGQHVRLAFDEPWPTR
jgi:hypothetical protein